MSKRTAVLSMGYWFSAYTLGLLLHPYKTARELTREKRFRALFWSPLVYWVLLWVVGVAMLRLGGLIVGTMGWNSVGGVVLGVLGFLWWWVAVFLIMWQVLLGYLWWRLRQLSE